MPISFKIAILVLTGLMGISLILRYNLDTPAPYVAHFRSKDCFKLYGSRGEQADGHITSVGEMMYTVMWYKEANRRYAGPKAGYRIPIKYLDQYASKAKCSWR